MHNENELQKGPRKSDMVRLHMAEKGKKTCKCKALKGAETEL